MPDVLRPCATHGCRELVECGRCAKHTTTHERERGKTGVRGYDWDWQQLRLLKLREEPVCQIQTHCQGDIATEVDHVISIRLRPDLRLVWENLQSACKPCNVAKAHGSLPHPKRAENGP